MASYTTLQSSVVSESFLGCLSMSSKAAQQVQDADNSSRAGFFPGAILLISKWYMPHESQTRIAIFFTASAIAGAFSGLLAFAISKMDGVGGYEGWRWVWLLGFCLVKFDADTCRSLSLKVSHQSLLVSLAFGFSSIPLNTHTSGSHPMRSTTSNCAKSRQAASNPRVTKRRPSTGASSALSLWIGRYTSSSSCSGAT